MLIPILRYYTDLIHVLADDVVLQSAERHYRSYMQNRYYAASNMFYFFESKRRALWSVAGHLHQDKQISTILLWKIRLYFILIYLIDIIAFIIKTPQLRLSYIEPLNTDQVDDTIEFVNGDVVIKTATAYMNKASSQLIARDKKIKITLAQKCKILMTALRYRTIAFRAIAQYFIIRDFWTASGSSLKGKTLICVEGGAYQDYFHIWHARQNDLKTIVVVPFIYTVPYDYHVTSVVVTTSAIADEFSAINDDVIVMETSWASHGQHPDQSKKIGLGFGSNILISDQQIITNINEIVLSSSLPKDNWYLSLHPQIRFNKARLSLFQSQLPEGLKIREREPNDAFLDEIDIMITERSTFLEEALTTNKSIIVFTNGPIWPAEEKLCAKFPSRLWYCSTIDEVLQATADLLGNNKLQ